MEPEYAVLESRPEFSVPDALHRLGFSRVAPLNTATMSDEDVALWWEFMRREEYMFSDFRRGQREVWEAWFRDMRHLHLDFGGDGYAVLADAWTTDAPEFHFCVWNPSRPFRDVLRAGEEIFNFSFDYMKHQRVGGFIPEVNTKALKFATLMGFRFEGCMRKAFRFKGQALDVHIYGLLREEWAQRKERLSHGRHSDKFYDEQRGGHESAAPESVH